MERHGGVVLRDDRVHPRGSDREREVVAGLQEVVGEHDVARDDGPSVRPAPPRVEPVGQLRSLDRPAAREGQRVIGRVGELPVAPFRVIQAEKQNRAHLAVQGRRGERRQQRARARAHSHGYRSADRRFRGRCPVPDAATRKHRREQAHEDGAAEQPLPIKHSFPFRDRAECIDYLSCPHHSGPFWPGAPLTSGERSPLGSRSGTETTGSGPGRPSSSHSARKRASDRRGSNHGCRRE